MFIHEMTIDECRRVLASRSVGRLACARENQPYVVPINFAFDGNCIYGFTTLGQKIEWLRSNPLVCFELDEVTSRQQWISIVVFGRYEEMPDTPQYKAARRRAHLLLQKQGIWWEPACICEEDRDYPHSSTLIVYRIHIDKITGHHAASDHEEAISNPVLNSKVNQPQFN